jgi:hypothetical protein
MARDYARETLTDSTQNEAYKQWVEKRVETIHNTIEAADILSKNGVYLRYNGSRPEQIRCPFHGDKNPSARFYPAQGDSRAGVWCFVCSERWDAISLWRKFNEFEGPFTALLRSIESELGITPPEAPLGAVHREWDNEEKADLENMFQAVENRLRSSRAAFDLKGYLTLSSILDRLYYRVEKGRIGRESAQETLQKILDKIGEKNQACPGD